MKPFLIFVFFAVTSITAFSQDAHFSQYNSTRLHTNPAFAGTDSALVVSSAYRIQWPKIGGTYKTFNFSADQYIGFLQGGLGVNFMHDDQMDGAFTHTSFDIMYSPEIPLAGKKLIVRPAIQAGYFKNTLDWSKLTFGDMIDARRGFVYNANEMQPLSSKSNIDFSAGVLVYGAHFHMGAAVYHLTEPDQGFRGPSKLPMRITINAGANLNFKGTENLTFFPTVLYQKQQDFQMYIAGLNARYKMLLFGISYRFDDAAIAMLGFQNKYLRVSYTFDYTTSKLTQRNTGGSHELQLSCFLHYKKRNTAKAVFLI